MTKDFDAARRAAKPKTQREPVTFKLFGRTWTAREIPDSLYIDAFADGDSAEDKTHAARALRSLVDTLVIPDQTDEWRHMWRHGEEPRAAVAAKRATKTAEAVAADPGSPGYDGLSLEDIRNVIGYVGEQQVGRPTTPSPNSLRSGGGTGTRSTHGTNARAGSPRRR